METNRQSKLHHMDYTLPGQQNWREYHCQGPLLSSWSCERKARRFILLRIRDTNTTPTCLPYSALISGPAEATLIQFKTPQAAWGRSTMGCMPCRESVPFHVLVPFCLCVSSSQERRNIKVIKAPYERKMKSLRILEQASRKDQLWSPGAEGSTPLLCIFIP